MSLSRFDSTRLRPIDPGAVGTRHCSRTTSLIAACRLGAGAAPRGLVDLASAVRIEMPFACYQLVPDDAEIAHRACLQLDGSWVMADASGVGRLAIRARALWTDIAFWRAPRKGDAWDAGEAVDAAALAGFVPRRHTLIVVPGDPGMAGYRTLADLERQAPRWRRAVRVLLLGAPPGTARYLSI
jgi:hypothetical protein